MGADKASKVSNDRLQWQKIFNALVHMFQTQQIQLESLAKERQLLKDRIQMQHDRWVSDVHLLEEQISQMRMNVSQAELHRLVEVAKSDLIVGLKQREVFLCKLKLGDKEIDLKDLKFWADCLTLKCSEQKGGSQFKTTRTDKRKGGGVDGYPKVEEQRCSNILEGELRKLKRAQEKHTSQYNSEVSPLRAERNFVWNQFKKMESDYNSLLKSKRIETEQANQCIKKLLSNMEQLQSSNSEKDETILMLRTKLGKLEEDMEHNNQEISRLSRELEMQRTSTSASVTPVLGQCMMGITPCSSQSNKTGKDSKLHIKKDSTGQHTMDFMKESEEGCRKSLKRRHVQTTPTSETPRLLSSTFKVPKLKETNLT